MTFTVIGWIRCPQNIQRGLRLCLYIMPFVPTLGGPSHPIHQTLIAEAVLAQLRYMPPQSFRPKPKAEGGLQDTLLPFPYWGVTVGVLTQRRAHDVILLVVWDNQQDNTVPVHTRCSSPA